jgi:hypothetical protein
LGWSHRSRSRIRRRVRESSVYRQRRCRHSIAFGSEPTGRRCSARTQRRTVRRSFVLWSSR